MGSSVSRVLSPVKSMLGLQRDPQAQGQLGAFQRTPQQIEAENNLLKQLAAQASGQANPASDIANQRAISMGVTQSGQSSNPFLGIRAGQQAQADMQAQAQLGAQQQLSDLLAGQKSAALQATQSAAQARQDENARRSGFISNLAGSAATFFKPKEPTGDSDKNNKENIKVVQDSGGKIDEFLSKLDPYTFEYKNGDLGSKQMGVMAQDLEKSDIGSAVVENSPEGKKVRLDKIGLPILAAQSDMFKRIKELEDKVKKRA